MALREKDLLVIRAYMVEGRGHRWIEDHILKIPSSKHLGFSTMEILHKFGLDKSFKNFFADINSQAQFDQLLNTRRDLISNQKLNRDELLQVWEPTQNVYIFQRVIRNNDGWMNPTPGRLGYPKDGEYLKENGFGHEDWNFNTSLSINDFIYGYLYYVPAQAKRNKRFHIAFCEKLNDGGWAVVGFYRNAQFIEQGSPKSMAVLQQKIEDLQVLRRIRSLGGDWDVEPTQMKKLLINELSFLRWKVAPQDIVRMPFSLEIPGEVELPKNERITTPSEIDAVTFNTLFQLSEKAAPLNSEQDDEGFPEGAIKLQQHRRRERRREVIIQAKEQFLKKHGHFFCEACGFDFAKVYGDVGHNFIEAHHTIAVSELKEGDKTFAKDIALLCSNCHRMVHRRRPWLSMDKLKDLVKVHGPIKSY